MRFRTLCLTAALMGLSLAGCPQTSTPPPDTPARGTIETVASVNVESAKFEESVALTAETVGTADAISYYWVQIAGPGVRLLDEKTAHASFTAPSLESGRTLRFRVSTRNAPGDVGVAEVELVVEADPNFGQQSDTGGSGAGQNLPVARAGRDQQVVAEDTVTLHGSSSTGQDLKYRWRQLSGTTVSLSAEDEVEATFEAPTPEDATEDLELELRVTDPLGRSSRDRVLITVIGGGGGELGTPEKPRVRFVTTLGAFTLELDREKAPLSVDNFLEYVDDEFYDGTIFHRVISGFVVQGGGFSAGLTKKDTRDPITNESDNGEKNGRGTVAMARTSDPNSATSQFYINLVDNDSLNATDGADGYAVFGRVVEGMSTLDSIAGVDTTTRNGMNDVPVDEVRVFSARNLVASPQP